MSVSVQPRVAGHIGDRPTPARCWFCHRLHAIEPVDHDSQAVCQVRRIVWAAMRDGDAEPGPGENKYDLVCAHCAQHSDRLGRDVYAIEALSPLVQLEYVDAEVNEELASLLSASAPEEEWRGDEWRVVADRLLKRVGEDEAEMDAIMRAAELEVALVRGNAARQRQTVENRLWWRKNALKAIAQALFPNAEARTNIGGKKSLSLTHGTIGRKDTNGAPVLRDELEALKAVWQAGRLDVIKLKVNTTIAAFRARLTEFGEDLRNHPSETVGAEVWHFLGLLLGDEDSGATKELAWGDLKKQLQETGEVFDGVEYSAPSVEFIAKPNKAAQ